MSSPSRDASCHFPPRLLVTSRVAEFVWGRLVRETNRRLSAPRGPTLVLPSAHWRAERRPSGRSVRTHHRRRGLRPWRRHGRALGGRPRSRPPACLASDRTPTPRQAGQAAQPRPLSRGSSRPPSTTPVCAAGPVRVDSGVAVHGVSSPVDRRHQISSMTLTATSDDIHLSLPTTPRRTRVGGTPSARRPRSTGRATAATHSVPPPDATGHRPDERDTRGERR